MADETFNAEERAAMQELAKERKRAGRGGSGTKKAAADRQALLDKVAGMPPSDRVIAEALHEIVSTHAPDLAPRTWYGMPAYARAGKVIVFFKPAQQFKVRYPEVGFNEHAQLDDGAMWPTVFAVTEVTDAVVAALTDLVVRAAAEPSPEES